MSENIETALLPGLKYALGIINDVPKFVDFSIAMLDYFGEDYLYVKCVYTALSSLYDSFGTNLEFDNYDEISKYSNESIIYLFRIFKKEQEDKNRQQEFKENIDELQFLVKEYRSSEEFQKTLDFVGRFKYLAPYNAMLVEMQKPGATFVLTGKKWREYNRRPVVNAQKLITLMPFGPVQCMFDFADTETIDDTKEVSAAQLMEEWYNGLKKTKGSVSQEVMSVLMHNLIQYGIYVDDSFSAANTYGGYIMNYTDKVLMVTIKEDHKIPYNSRFIISINKNQTDVEKFHTICHELGHLFCRHQYYTNKKRRSLTTKEKEFEAETVAWLICKRHNIENPSEEYLAGYDPNGIIPICSTEFIMKAVTEIEKMISGKVNIKDSTWYKEDNTFSHRVQTSLTFLLQDGKKHPQYDLFHQRK